MTGGTPARTLSPDVAALIGQYHGSNWSPLLDATGVTATEIDRHECRDHEVVLERLELSFPNGAGRLLYRVRSLEVDRGCDVFTDVRAYDNLDTARAEYQRQAAR